MVLHGLCSISAEPVGEAALAEAESAIALLEADQKQFQFALEAVAGVSDSFRRTLLVAALQTCEFLELTKTTATEQVGLCVKQSEAKRAEAQHKRGKPFAPIAGDTGAINSGS